LIKNATTTIATPVNVMMSISFANPKIITALPVIIKMYIKDNLFLECMCISVAKVPVAIINK
jgi:hypothetical protein